VYIDIIDIDIVVVVFFHGADIWYTS